MSPAKELSQVRAFLLSGMAKPVRVNAHLSFRDMGRAVGVSPSTILRWEAGERRPTGKAALRYWRLVQELMAK